ncbi:MAG: hypothetical protein Q9169_000530 [Polycauliona sp. 2 TL-2023]
MTAIPCKRSSELPLSLYLKKQLGGLEQPVLDLHQEFNQAQHQMYLELQGRLPAPSLPGPYLDAVDDAALVAYFNLFDKLIFDNHLSQWVDLSWSQNILEPARATKSTGVGRILLKVRSPATTSNLYYGDDALEMISALLGEMCLAWMDSSGTVYTLWPHVL